MIYNIQGIEAENIVVIMGDELQVVDGELRCKEWVYNDPKARYNYLKTKKSSELTADEMSFIDGCIKNIYRTLLTRGLKSCRLYCEDPQICDLFR